MKHLDVCLGYKVIIWGDYGRKRSRLLPELSIITDLHTLTIHGTGMFTYIWLIFMVNVGRYTIHGCYGIWMLLFICPKNWGCLMYPWRIRVAILHLPTFAIHTPYIGTTFGFWTHIDGKGRKKVFFKQKHMLLSHVPGVFLRFRDFFGGMVFVSECTPDPPNSKVSGDLQHPNDRWSLVW